MSEVDPLGWSIPANLRWMCDNQQCYRTPSGALAGQVLQSAANSIDQLMTELAASRAREAKLREALQKIARNWSIVFNSPGMSTNEAVDMARAALSASEAA